MCYIDLHVHSTASDGTYTPSELIGMAKQLNLSAIALTDHDTIDGIEEAVAKASSSSVTLIPGIELSCGYGSREIHMLGLNIDYTNQHFIQHIEYMRQTRYTRNLEIIEKFHDIGIDISYEEMNTMFEDTVITRTHFAAYLYRKGHVTSVKDAFDRYLNDYGCCYVPRFLIPAHETIQIIHEASGFAVLAHPVRYHMGADETSKMVSALSRSGLDGIEALYSTYTNSDEIFMRRLAKENHLFITGGSDFHGDNKPRIQLGSGMGRLKVPAELLKNIMR